MLFPIAQALLSCVLEIHLRLRFELLRAKIKMQPEIINPVHQIFLQIKMGSAGNIN